jgi:hypothetical protein
MNARGHLLLEAMRANGYRAGTTDSEGLYYAVREGGVDWWEWKKWLPGDQTRIYEYVRARIPAYVEVDMQHGLAVTSEMLWLVMWEDNNRHDVLILEDEDDLPPSVRSDKKRD